MLWRTLNVLSLGLPAALGLIWPSLSAYEFNPRRVFYSLDTQVLVLAPWICRPSIYALGSRIIQAGIVFRSHKLVLLHGYALWFAIGGGRILTGWLFTRAVGWAYPVLFSHFSLYETSSGLGPSVAALTILAGVRDWPEMPSRRVEIMEPLALAAICATLAWMDDAPWTYAVAIMLVVPLAVCCRLLPEHTTGDQLLPAPTTKLREKPLRIRPRRSILASVLACLTAIVALQLRPPTLYVVRFPSQPSPLLDILVLSYPRPGDIPESSILNTTLMSFLPLTRVPGVSVSVFTHAETHPSFAWAKAHFPEVEFYADKDQHPDADSGQHLHVAEALRWASTRQAEWVMLLEDDFPLCGLRGRDALARVMQKLERGRTPDYLERRGAFVGTGGSGLIFHRTLLPIVSTVLKLHANTESTLPVDVIRRPADLIMQDCLLGIDPLCPRRAEVMGLHADTTAAPVSTGGNLVITSRLIIDHIGAVASTHGREYGQDQWRCGWRHPFHGRDEVDVVLV
ncbi:hypothetical protein C8R47DRAFT_1020229 [Mycena vitilis]|nr:hypothetical protein C8R47DRAFT_1020229 [Mycena vitilis]